MARKGNKSAGYKECTCSKCGMVTNSTPSTPHRRCPGQPDQPLRSRGNNIPGELRGTWQ